MTVPEALRAGGPDGTMSGCFKARTMQIIHEPQRTPRCSHTGSVGGSNRDSHFDSNILIRSALLRVLEIA
ncbi:MAG: chorismate-binding protein [Rhizobium sp.]|nr:chorismate-binding protein [Rhizobium sp.]